MATEYPYDIEAQVILSHFFGNKTWVFSGKEILKGDGFITFGLASGFSICERSYLWKK